MPLPPTAPPSIYGPLPCGGDPCDKICGTPAGGGSNLPPPFDTIVCNEPQRPNGLCVEGNPGALPMFCKPTPGVNSGDNIVSCPPPIYGP